MYKITNITKSDLKHQDKGKTIFLASGESAVVFYKPREEYNFKIEDLDKSNLPNHIEQEEKKEEIKSKRRLNK